MGPLRADRVRRWTVADAGQADLNSVRVQPAGCFVLDARLRLVPPAVAGRTRTW